MFIPKCSFLKKIDDDVSHVFHRVITEDLSLEEEMQKLDEELEDDLSSLDD